MPFCQVPDIRGAIRDEGLQPVSFHVMEGGPKDRAQTSSFWSMGSADIGGCNLAGLVPPCESFDGTAWSDTPNKRIR